MVIKSIQSLYRLSWFKCARRWYRMQIFYSHFYWFLSCILKQILTASIFRQLRLKNYKQTNDRLSWWQSFWRLNIINGALR